MPIPSIGGGYQVGDGNVNEIKLGTQGAPAAITDAATITAAQLATGLLVLTSAGDDTYTLPTVALWEAVASNAKINSSFDFAVVSLSGTSTLAVGTGWTLVGHATVASVSGQWRARKTGDGTWTAYRIA